MFSSVLLKNVSFDVKNDEDIEMNLKNSFEIHTYKTTMDLFKLMQSLLGEGLIQIINCEYDDKTVIQACYLDKKLSDDELHKNMLFYKRKINENDTYTFMNYETTNYNYVDVSIDDIKQILQNKFKHKGVIVTFDGDLIDVEYSQFVNPNENVGTMKIKGIKEDYYKEFKYYLVSNMHDKFEDENFESLLSNELMKENTEFVEDKLNLNICALNLYYKLTDTKCNDTISKLRNAKICGDVLVGLENIHNDDDRIFNLNSETFEKLLKFDINTNKSKNSCFCNVYYECF